MTVVKSSKSCFRLNQIILTYQDFDSAVILTTTCPQPPHRGPVSKQPGQIVKKCGKVIL